MTFDREVKRADGIWGKHSNVTCEHMNDQCCFFSLLVLVFLWSTLTFHCMCRPPSLNLNKEFISELRLLLLMWATGGTWSCGNIHCTVGFWEMQSYQTLCSSSALFSTSYWITGVHSAVSRRICYSWICFYVCFMYIPL